MTDRHTIAIVEDNRAQRILLARTLEKDYEVVEFSSGEDFLTVAPAVDALLLDIEMPGIDGYETCRRMRQQEKYSDTPVIFVSGHDTPAERIAAYEAGGDHFLTKPVAVGEIRLKVESVLNHRAELRSLRSQSSMAQQMAFSIMSGMGELGVIIEFQRRAATCRDYESLTRHAVQALNDWGLRGMVQVRGKTGTVNQGTDAVISPIQASVMETMRGMGRIFEMKSRAVVNYEHVSILIQNLPSEEPEKLGRIRDNLTLLGEAADICTANMDTSNFRQAQIRHLGGTVAQLTEMMQQAARRDADNRQSIRKQIMETLDGLSGAFTNLGLTSIQSEYIGNLLHDGVDELAHAFEEASTIQRDFTDILVSLQELAKYAPQGQNGQ